VAVIVSDPDCPAVSVSAFTDAVAPVSAGGGGGVGAGGADVDGSPPPQAVVAASTSREQVSQRRGRTRRADGGVGMDTRSDRGDGTFTAKYGQRTRTW
jgi:hypothetical protein